MHRIRKHLQKQTQTQRRQQNNENTKEKDMYEEVHILFLSNKKFLGEKKGVVESNEIPGTGELSDHISSA